MSEAGWLGLATLIVNAIGAGFLIWMKFKMATLQTGVNDGNNSNQVIISQNTAQNTKLETIHTDINGRVAELIAAQVKIELAKVVALQLVDAGIVDGVKDKEKK